MSRNRSKLIALGVLLLIGVGLALWRDGVLDFSAPAAEAHPVEEPTLKAPATAPAEPPKDTNAEPVDPKREEFKKLARQILKSLPHRADLRALSSEEVHLTPAPLREAALKIGHLADLMEEDPDLKPDGLAFYQKCSLQKEGTTAVRAVCLNRALRLYAELHQALWDFDREKVPDRVLELAKRL